MPIFSRFSSTAAVSAGRCLPVDSKAALFFALNRADVGSARIYRVLYLPMLIAPAILSEF